jgi:hypothetical protein
MHYIRQADGKNGKILSERPRMQKFLNFLENECGLKNAYYLANPKKFKDDLAKDNIKLRSFVSAELEKMFELIFPCVNPDRDCNGRTGNLSELLWTDGDNEQNEYKLGILNGIWLQFYKIYQITKNER